VDDSGFFSRVNNILDIDLVGILQLLEVYGTDFYRCHEVGNRFDSRIEDDTAA
jgi:hypothetical protein